MRRLTTGVRGLASAMVTGLLVCGACMGGTRVAAARAATNPIGAHSMLQLSAPFSFKQRMFAEAAAMHASAIRLDVQPSIVFSTASAAPNLTGLDEVMALSQQYHLRVIADLLSIPSWIANCRRAVADPTRCGTDDLAAYRAAIALIVGHADQVIRDWEVWNEPDNPGFFTGTPQQYALMLRTAHDAIKQIDPQANVLLGGISGTRGMSWLAQVLLTPGADAAHAFDIANVHERGRLAELAPDLAAWKQFFAKFAFSGPLWVTEHGYPADPAYQYDPGYQAGTASQAAFLTASVPAMVDAGAAEVFVTERDNLNGQFASEGLLGGTVPDPPVADPLVLEKPSYSAVATLGGCYIQLGRDCPGPAPAASPAALTLPAASAGSASTSILSISNPGREPLQLGTASLTGSGAEQLEITQDGCTARILVPGQACSATVRFSPDHGGAVQAALQMPSDDGTLSVPVSAVAPSVAGLTVSRSAFQATGAVDRAGQIQRLVVDVRNPLSAPVPVAAAALSAPGRRGFALQSDRCRGAQLAPGASCRMTVRFTPSGAGAARATLTLWGGEAQVRIGLRAGPYAPPAVMRVATSACLARESRSRVLVVTDEPASVRWQIVPSPAAPASRCGGHPTLNAVAGQGGRSSAGGSTATVAATILIRGTGRSVGRFTLPRGLRPGTYLLRAWASNTHGTGQALTVWVTVRA